MVFMTFLSYGLYDMWAMLSITICFMICAIISVGR